jgi:hypothetical protein
MFWIQIHMDPLHIDLSESQLEYGLESKREIYENAFLSNLINFWVCIDKI